MARKILYCVCLCPLTLLSVYDTILTAVVGVVRRRYWPIMMIHTTRKSCRVWRQTLLGVKQEPTATNMPLSRFCAWSAVLVMCAENRKQMKTTFQPIRLRQISTLEPIWCRVPTCYLLLWCKMQNRFSRYRQCRTCSAL